MATPWTLAWARSSAAGADRIGTVYDIAYRAPAGTSHATAVAQVGYGTYYGGESGVWGSRLAGVYLRPGLDTGEVLVVYHYEPPRADQVLIDNTNYVLVNAELSRFSYRPEQDADGNWVHHEEYDQAAGKSYKWEPEQGTGVKQEMLTLYRQRMAKPYNFMANIQGYATTANLVMEAQWDYAPQGTLRIAGAARQRAPTTDKLYLYDILIERYWIPWNSETRVRKYEWRTYEVPVLQADGTATDETRPIGQWYPLAGTVTPARWYGLAQWPLMQGVFDW